MKTYKTQEEVDKDIVDGVLEVKEDVMFKFSFSIKASLKVAGNIEALNIEALNIEALNIEALNIEAGDIEAGDIKAWNIEAGDIKALNIEAWNIEAGDIEAGDIKALNIEAWNIEAGDIEAGDISFYAVAFAYFSFKCKSIIGRRKNAKYFCLDKEVEINPNP